MPAHTFTDSSPLHNTHSPMPAVPTLTVPALLHMRPHPQPLPLALPPTASPAVPCMRSATCQGHPRCTHTHSPVPPAGHTRPKSRPCCTHADSPSLLHTHPHPFPPGPAFHCLTSSALYTFRHLSGPLLSLNSNTACTGATHRDAARFSHRCPVHHAFLTPVFQPCFLKQERASSTTWTPTRFAQLQQTHGQASPAMLAQAEGGNWNGQEGNCPSKTPASGPTTHESWPGLVHAWRQARGMSHTNWAVPGSAAQTHSKCRTHNCTSSGTVAAAAAGVVPR